MQDVLDKCFESEDNLEYLCSLSRKKDSLMLYTCDINNCKGTATTDTAASRNFISKDYALRSNVKFMKDRSRSVSLPDGDTMHILGCCEVDVQLSEWKGRIRAMIIEL